MGRGRQPTHGSDGERELRHGVERRRAGVDEVLDELGDGGAGGPVGRELGALLGGRDLARQEQPEEGLGQGLVTAGRLGQELLALGDGLAAEADTLVGVKDGSCGSEGDGEGISLCFAGEARNLSTSSLDAPSQIMPCRARRSDGVSYRP